jgi:integrase
MATIRKKGNLQWHVQIRKKGFEPVTKTFNTRNDAALWAKTVESEMGRGIYVSRAEAERTTLHDALSRYLTEITPKKKGQAQETVRINRWLGIKKKKPDNEPEPAPSPGHQIEMQLVKRTLASLNSTDFSKLMDERLKEISPATLHRDFSLLSHVFTICNKKWGIAVANPLANIIKPGVRNARERRFEGDEESRLFAALAGSKNPWMRPLAELAIETAMRQSELLMITWKDVGAVSIHLNDTKNSRSRDVPLSLRAKAILNALPRSIGGNVFPTTKSAVVQAFPRACRRAKIKGLTFHDLRHEATSRLAQKLPLHDLMKMTGHKDTEMLARYYHPRIEDLARMLG